MSFMLKDPDLEKGSDGDLANETRRPSYRPRVLKMYTSCNNMIYYSGKRDDDTRFPKYIEWY